MLTLSDIQENFKIITKEEFDYEISIMEIDGLEKMAEGNKAVNQVNLTRRYIQDL